MLNLISKAWASVIGPGDLPPAVGPDYCDNLNWDNLELRALMCIFNRIYNLVIYTVGAVSIIWIIISGIRYLTAGADEEKVANAQRSLTFAVLGFLVVIAAHAIIVIIGNLLGIDIPIFRIPGSTT